MFKKLALLTLCVGILSVFAFAELKWSKLGTSPISRAPSSTLDREDEPLSGILGPLLPPSGFDPEKSKLGKALFFEPKLSKDGTVSCASCHDLNHGGVDGRQFSVGIGGKVGNTNAPTVFNSFFNFRQFWDGRAENLTEQLEGPIQNPGEMGSAWEDIIAKLKKDPRYSTEFSRLFQDGVTHENIAASIVDFEKTLVTLNSPFDKYLKGDETALTKTQISGYKKFTQNGCVACHQGRNIGGNMFQTFGIADDYFKNRGGFLQSDLGRYNVTKLESDKHVFRVPSLRNIELTAPYFHDGSAKTLEEAVHVMARYQLGRSLPEKDISDIVAFLKSLTGDLPATVKTTSPINER